MLKRNIQKKKKIVVTMLYFELLETEIYANKKHSENAVTSKSLILMFDPDLTSRKFILFVVAYCIVPWFQI